MRVLTWHRDFEFLKATRRDATSQATTDTWTDEKTAMISRMN